MLRTLLIMISRWRWARRVVSQWGIAKRMALRFVAGETLEEAIEVVRGINATGMSATLDFLGEDTSTEEEARNAAGTIREVVHQIEHSGVKSNISLKLTQLGLKFDEELCRENLISILQRAKDADMFVRIDMEDSPFLEATFSIFSEMRDNHGFENVGLVIQSYFYRSKEDTQRLLEKNTRIRLVKGAYKEPVEIAFPHKKEVDEAFDEIGEVMIISSTGTNGWAASEDGKWPPITAIATHDEKRVAYAKDAAERAGLSKDRLEFQMLYGIRRNLQEELCHEGYPVRVYVPFGEEWFPYYMRRLAERPANLWFFLSNLVKR